MSEKEKPELFFTAFSSLFQYFDTKPAYVTCTDYINRKYYPTNIMAASTRIDKLCLPLFRDAAFIVGIDKPAPCVGDGVFPTTSPDSKPSVGSPCGTSNVNVT